MNIMLGVNSMKIEYIVKLYDTVCDLAPVDALQ